MKILGTALFATIVLAPAAFGQGPVPAGEFQLNSYTTFAQRAPSIAELPGGGFVAVWYSFGSGGSDDSTNSIQARRYADDGSPLGAEFQVNSYAAGNQSFPIAAGLAGGSFVTVWESAGSFGSDSSQTSIQGQLYGAGGTALGAQFQVNTYTTGSQSGPALAALADGGFAVAWSGAGSGPDTLGTSIRGQRYGADGSAVGTERQVNSFAPGLQTNPWLAALADGGFVVAWASSGSVGSDNFGTSIQGRRVNAEGTALGEQFQVNTYTFADQRFPRAAALAAGGFVVTWHNGSGSPSDASFTSIQGQRYASDGVPAGGQFQVNSTTTGFQQFSAVTGLADGGFLVAWESDHSSGSDAAEFSIQARRYAAGGAPVNGEFQVNSTTAGSQRFPAVTAFAGGGFMAAWESDRSSGSDTSSLSIQGQRYFDPRFALVGLGGKCLDVEGGGRAGGGQMEAVADGTPVDLFPCHGGESQRWQLNLTAVPQRISGIDGKCLVPGLVDDTGDLRLVIGACGGPDELWRLGTPSHAEPSVLVHDQTGMCLDAEDGMPVILFDCHGSEGQLWRPAAETCTRDSLGLCLNGERFRVEVEWHSFDDTVGSGKAVPVGADDSGLLWFFESDNWEMLVKVLDGCGFNDRFWVFAAATTTVEYTLRVTDTALGTIREYFNPLGNAAAAITDTDAFATCSATSGSATSGSATSGAAAGGSAERPPAVEVAKPIAQHRDSALKGACVTSPSQMCLNDDRFSVEVTWRDYAGNTGVGRVIDAATNDASGLFWFFESDNWEMLVKVLDACDLNGQFLFLGAASTDVEYTVQVTDTDTGVVWEHANPLGQASEALVHWFDTCP